MITRSIARGVARSTSHPYTLSKGVGANAVRLAGDILTLNGVVITFAG